MNYFTGGYKGFLNIALKEGVAGQIGAAIVQQIMAANPGMSLEQAQLWQLRHNRVLCFKNWMIQRLSLIVTRQVGELRLFLEPM